MTLRSETAQFLKDLEVSAGKKLFHRERVGEMIDLARSGNQWKSFEDCIFLAKFLSKSFDLMKRIGPDGEGYEKVAEEFQSSMERAIALVRQIVERSPASVQEDFDRTFFRLGQENISAFMNLMRDLSRVKNWMLDGKPLP